MTIILQAIVIVIIALVVARISWVSLDWASEIALTRRYPRNDKWTYTEDWKAAFEQSKRGHRVEARRYYYDDPERGWFELAPIEYPITPYFRISRQPAYEPEDWISTSRLEQETKRVVG